MNKFKRLSQVLTETQYEPQTKAFISNYFKNNKDEFISWAYMIVSDIIDRAPEKIQGDIGDQIDLVKVINSIIVKYPPQSVNHLGNMLKKYTTWAVARVMKQQKEKMGEYSLEYKMEGAKGGEGGEFGETYGPSVEMDIPSQHLLMAEAAWQLLTRKDATPEQRDEWARTLGKESADEINLSNLNMEALTESYMQALENFHKLHPEKQWNAKIPIYSLNQEIERSKDKQEVTQQQTKKLPVDLSRFVSKPQEIQTPISQEFEGKQQRFTETSIPYELDKLNSFSDKLTSYVIPLLKGKTQRGLAQFPQYINLQKPHEQIMLSVLLKNLFRTKNAYDVLRRHPESPAFLELARKDESGNFIMKHTKIVEKTLSDTDNELNNYVTQGVLSSEEKQAFLEHIKTYLSSANVNPRNFVTQIDVMMRYGTIEFLKDNEPKMSQEGTPEFDDYGNPVFEPRTMSIDYSQIKLVPGPDGKLTFAPEELQRIRRMAEQVVSLLYPEQTSKSTERQMYIWAAPTKYKLMNLLASPRAPKKAEEKVQHIMNEILQFTKFIQHKKEEGYDRPYHVVETGGSSPEAKMLSIQQQIKERKQRQLEEENMNIPSEKLIPQDKEIESSIKSWIRVAQKFDKQGHHHAADFVERIFIRIWN